MSGSPTPRRQSLQATGWARALDPHCAFPRPTASRRVIALATATVRTNRLQRTLGFAKKHTSAVVG